MIGEAPSWTPVWAMPFQNREIKRGVDCIDDLVGSTGKFEPFVRETQPDQFMSLH